MVCFRKHKDSAECEERFNSNSVANAKTNTYMRREPIEEEEEEIDFRVPTEKLEKVR